MAILIFSKKTDVFDGHLFISFFIVQHTMG